MKAIAYLYIRNRYTNKEVDRVPLFKTNPFHISKVKESIYKHLDWNYYIDDFVAKNIWNIYISKVNNGELKKMNILVACEFSGIVRSAFAKLGHNVWSCDLLDTEIPGQHIKGNVLDYIDQGWDMMIAHPPCTYLTNSGARWKYEKPGWVEEQEKAVDFFMQFVNSNVPLIAIENPIGIMSTRHRKPDQIVQPWMFGHGETKATCFWLKGLPNLEPTNIVEGRANRVHREPPGPERWKNRSRTFTGIAEAMANQWGICKPENEQAFIFSGFVNGNVQINY